MTTRGMIQVAGRTYRIVEVERAVYRAVRIADELELGVFRAGPPLQLWARSFAASELRDVARSAIRSGKTRWGDDGRPFTQLVAAAMGRTRPSTPRRDVLAAMRHDSCLIPES